MRPLLLFILLLIPASVIAQTTYYVSKSGGNDLNIGTDPAQPWKTLEKVNSFKPDPGDKILFKRGDKWEGTLTVPASGNPIRPITYGAYGTGDKPTIYGSQEITGWTLHSGYIYKASLATDVNQVFVDGERMQAARYPNAGYFFPTTISSKTKITSSSLNSGINYAGANIICRTSRWRYFGTKVSSSSSQTLSLTSELRYGISLAEGFILTNKIDFLDQAGEWYYDSTAKTIYLWTPKGGSPSNTIVRGSINNTVEMTFRNYVTFENLNLSEASGAGVQLTSANDITIDSCDISKVGGYGVLSTNTCHYLTVKNSRIINSINQGIRNLGNYSSFSDNLIKDIGRFSSIGAISPGTSTAISTTGNNVTFRYNKIENIGYNGIMFAGMDNVIEYNYINGVNKDLDDGAGIYTYSPSYTNPGSSGTVIRYNIVLNAYGNSEGTSANYPMAYGIYLDNGIHGVVVEHNTIAHTSGGIFLNKNSGDNTICHNTVMDAALLFLASDLHPKDLCSINNNTLYATARMTSFIWWQNSKQRLVKIKNSKFYNIDNNKYIHHYSSSSLFFWNTAYFGFNQWKTEVNGDANSTLDITTLDAGEVEKLFYNDTKKSKVFNLGTSIYKDIDGNKVSGNLSLKPFTSKILIKIK
jgi:hypothetical protein